MPIAANQSGSGSNADIAAIRGLRSHLRHRRCGRWKAALTHHDAKVRAGFLNFDLVTGAMSDELLTWPYCAECASLYD